MKFKALFQALSVLAISVAAVTAWGKVPASVQGPAQLPAGAYITVKWTGPDERHDRIGVVPVGTPDGASMSHSSPTSRSNPAEFNTPDKPGKYEIRYQGEHATLARAPITLLPVTKPLEAPTTAVAGSTVPVKWQGPDYRYDMLSIFPLGTPHGTRETGHSRVAAGGNPSLLVTPEQPGEYEIRYLSGYSRLTLGSAKITLTGASATIEGPITASAGAMLSVVWQGPNSKDDHLAVVPEGAPERTWPEGFTSVVRNGSPTKLLTPEKTGKYEVRYLSGQSNTTLGRTALTLVPLKASIEGPSEAEAGDFIRVIWKGPNNPHDNISLVPAGATDEQKGIRGFTRDGGPTLMQAPTEAGTYELRYRTGETNAILARAPLRVKPAKVHPGKIKVQAAATGSTVADGAVLIILDASGSMLQRLGGERRIEIAKRTLAELTTATIPEGTPFALRVFGREANSCRTDLEIPLQPLQPAAIAKRIAGLEAKQNAKTPIGASLAQVAVDLKSAKGERIVILVTDGEETCGGDPAGEIEKLVKAGIKLRVNIVGFAVEDKNLEAAFQLWSEVGRGRYFDARDAKGLKQAFAQAVQLPFEVIDSQGRLVASGLVGGDPVSVPAGKYAVKLGGHSQNVVVRAKALETVAF
jgi:Mg-chelatase subunit ChlD